MPVCLETKKSNCKNCYKCIRHCPVKSLKFTDGQAHIIREECVLCGECYVVCPQNAKRIRNDIEVAKELVKSNDVYVSLAPSYAAKYPNVSLSKISEALSKIGIKGAFETSEGAAIVKTEYEKLVKKGEMNIIISSCCHSVNTLIEKHYPDAVKYLAPVVTPMYAHATEIKKMHEGAKVLFVGPCISKKDEADKSGGVVDCVLTFNEFDAWLASENITFEEFDSSKTTHKTNAFPTSGGILKSMDLQKDFKYIVVDGMENCIKTLDNIEESGLKNCFIEMSACEQSCINGPDMRRERRNPIVDFMNVDKMYGEDEFDFTPIDGKTDKKFVFDGMKKSMPGSNAIEEVLRQMGKESRADELNCGSCGYNTCREKAVAVLMGKADMTMCLPYLMEKAESFSDIVIGNTPNGIIVIDEQLNIQQINKSAKKILNLPDYADVVGSPIVRVLDPVDYLIAADEGKNVYDNKKYLAQYQKYVEETIICNKKYKIITIMLKDVTAEEEERNLKEEKSKAAVEITDKVVEKQMRIVQEIASLLGETTAETKIALTKLKETLSDE